MNPGSIHAARTHWHAEAQELDVANALMERTQRDPIWREIESVFPARQQIPALNCGTGIDAVFLASREIRVWACDMASRMIELAQRRAALMNTTGPTDFRVLATEKGSTGTDPVRRSSPARPSRTPG
jgi:2-polyprenyl-3-methyl-5-hydroxy-6-metoxy-1,4-benzoquinol methylase